MYSVMWSEHCSYKSSQGPPAPVRREGTRRRDALLVGMGENAGVVDVGDGWAVTFKIESHNHPSYVEPYQGAATGVGGIVRDILTMGARPVAVHGPAALRRARRPRHRPRAARRRRRHRRLRQLPRPAQHRRRGRTSTTCYPGNPLVNALCVGVLRTDGIKLAKADGPGQQGRAVRRAHRRRRHRRRVRAGQRDLRRRAGRPKRPSVQVGDPFAEKVLIECCLEIFAADLVVGIQDLGAAGLSLRDHRAGRGRRPAAWTSTSTACRCATPRSRPKRS